MIPLGPRDPRPAPFNQGRLVDLPVLSDSTSTGHQRKTLVKPRSLSSRYYLFLKRDPGDWAMAPAARDASPAMIALPRCRRRAGRSTRGRRPPRPATIRAGGLDW